MIAKNVFLPAMPPTPSGVERLLEKERNHLYHKNQWNQSSEMKKEKVLGDFRFWILD